MLQEEEAIQTVADAHDAHAAGHLEAPIKEAVLVDSEHKVEGRRGPICFCRVYRTENGKDLIFLFRSSCTQYFCVPVELYCVAQTILTEKFANNLVKRLDKNVANFRPKTVQKSLNNLPNRRFIE